VRLPIKLTAPRGDGTVHVQTRAKATVWGADEDETDLRSPAVTRAQLLDAMRDGIVARAAYVGRFHQ
jgi:hypothetical protein